MYIFYFKAKLAFAPYILQNFFTARCFVDVSIELQQPVIVWNSSHQLSFFAYLIKKKRMVKKS